MDRTHREQRTHTHGARAREGGFTMIEILVALVIVMILAGAAIIAFRGSKTSTHAKEAISAGSALTQAISSYQADHQNQLPNAGNASQWSATQGPLNLLGKPYVPSIAGVSEGRIKLSTTDCGATATSGGTASGVVSYCSRPADAPNFAVRVAAQGPSGWADATVCWMGRSNKAPRCT